MRQLREIHRPKAAAHGVGTQGTAIVTYGRHRSASSCNAIHARDRATPTANRSSAQCSSRQKCDAGHSQPDSAHTKAFAMVTIRRRRSLANRGTETATRALNRRGCPLTKEPMRRSPSTDVAAHDAATPGAPRPTQAPPPADIARRVQPALQAKVRSTGSSAVETMQAVDKPAPQVPQPRTEPTRNDASNQQEGASAESTMPTPEPAPPNGAARNPTAHARDQRRRPKRCHAGRARIDGTVAHDRRGGPASRPTGHARRSATVAHDLSSVELE